MEPYAAVVDLLQTASEASPTEEGRLAPSGPVVVVRMRCGAEISRGQVKSSTTMTRAFGCAPLSSVPSRHACRQRSRKRRSMWADWRSRQREPGSSVLSQVRMERHEC